MQAPDDWIDRAWRAGQAAHPDLGLDRASFVRFLEQRQDASPADDDLAADLFLACACVNGLPLAIQAFVAGYLDRVPTYLARWANTPELIRDVQQQLAVRLLVREAGRPPLLESYAGRGPLGAFVRVVAGRVALDLQRRAARERRTLESAAMRHVGAEDPELALLKDVYREPFKQAFREAITALAPEHRAILRLHYVEGMTTEKLARLRGVGRATIVRRLGAARAALVEGLIARLRGRVAIDDGEITSYLRLLRSQLDLSMVRLLQETLS